MAASHLNATPNQALERTAARRIFVFRMNKTVSPHAARSAAWFILFSLGDIHASL